MKIWFAGILACLVVLIAVGSVHAVVLDDFDSLTVGAINGQNGWHADSASAGVGRDFTRDENQFLLLNGANNDVNKSLGAASIPNGQTGTLFFRFMATSAASNHGIGVTDVDAPSSFNNYRASALIYNDTRNVKMQGSSGSGNVDLTLNGGANGIVPLQWNDVWIVVNNSTDTADFYLRPSDSTQRYLVGSGLPFRNGSTTATIDTFLARVSSGTYDNVVLDDIHAWLGGVDAGAAELPAALAAPTLNVPALLNFSAQRLNAMNSSIVLTQYPSTTKTTDNTWNTTDQWGWTSGFYPGDLWQMYRFTGDTSYSTAAANRTAGLEGQKNNNGTHDIGFEIFNSFGQGYKLTNNSAYKDVIITAANTLSTRYSPVVGAIQSWGGSGDPYQVIIDNMMNIEMLFWASKHGGGSNLYDIAVQHALTTSEQFVRPDGGTYHVVEFNRTTGAVISKYTSQGYSNDSTWSRGQAWGIYGFTMSYRETGDTRFLQTAQQLADYFLNHLSVSGLPYYDFDDPANPPPYDTAAAAIASSGLLELMNYVNPTDRQRYFDGAKGMLLKLSGPGILSDGSTFQSILMQGTVSHGGANRVGTSYGDYYYIEALGRYDAAMNPITWTGSAGSSWNQNPLAPNWSKNGNAASYMDLNNVIFNDTAANTAVNIDWDYVRPASLLFNNSSKNYTLQGSYPIAGMCSLVKQGSGMLTISVPIGYSGTTTIEGGTLEIAGGIDDSGTSLIDIQSGTVSFKTVNVNKTNLMITTAPLATFEVVNGAHTVGNISGNGTTLVDSGASLTVASISQDNINHGQRGDSHHPSDTRRATGRHH